MRLTAKQVAAKLGIQYAVASGLMTYLESCGVAKVAEKKFHASGRGKPTRIYEVDQLATIDFGAEVVEDETPAAEDVTEVAAEDVTEVAAEDVTEVAAEDVTEVAAEDVTEVAAEDVTEEVVDEDEVKIETLDHVRAAMDRLKEDQAA